MTDANWIEANQRVLVAEFARIRGKILGRDAHPEIAAGPESWRAMARPPAIEVLSSTFGLTGFERDVLLLCAGTVMDESLALLCPPHGHATFGLALGALEGPHWSAISPIGPLRDQRLVHVHDERGVTTSRLSIDERVLHYLAGLNYLEPRLRHLIRAVTSRSALASSQESAVATAIAALATDDGRTLLQLIGDDTGAQLEIARRVSENYGLRLRVLDARLLAGTADDVGVLAALWNRESALLGNALLVRIAGDDSSAALRFLERTTGLVFISSATEIPLDGSQRLSVQKPDRLEVRQLWSDTLGDMATLLNGSIDAVAAQFRLDAADIVQAASRLRAVEASPQTLERELWRVCRERTRRPLDELAQRIELVATWSDLVLPEQQLTMLRQIAAQARHRLTVQERWGFGARSARGLGISVLFSGESGTGKTLAAEVLASELQLDLYRIDLASLVSKYIGETEKNLKRVFDAAEASGAILLFDEADALFGKRSEVKDSHDRYANIEVSYLLQKMEAYRGLAILTTNLKGGIDAAFQRRLQFVVHFPFPDAQLRERIWRGVFPRATPIAGVDAAKLAQLNVAGGAIRNIAIGAAFLAADAGSPIQMVHLLQAARCESLKRERPFSDAETRGWTCDA